MANIHVSGHAFGMVYARQTLALAIMMPLACVLVVFLRLSSRNNQVGGIRLDDWFIIAGMVSVIGMGVCLTIGIALRGIGYHSPHYPKGLTPKQELEFMPRVAEVAYQVNYSFQILLVLALGSIKLSVTFFYRHLFVVTSRSFFDILTRITIIVTALWTVIFGLISIFACGTHFTANWGNFIQQATYCQGLGAASYGMTLSDLILNVIVVLMPIPLVWRLKLPIWQKLSVTGFLLLGAAGIGFPIARFSLYVEMYSLSSSPTGTDPDLDITLVLYWSLLEAGLSLIAACLPILAVSPTAKTLGRRIRATFTDRRSKFSSTSSTNRPQISAPIDVVRDPYKLNALFEIKLKEIDPHLDIHHFHFEERASV